MIISQHTALMAEGKSGNKTTNSIETCSESKSKIREGPVSSCTREQCVDWLKGIVISYSGAKEDLIERILKFKKVSQSSGENQKPSKKKLPVFDILVTG